MTEDDKQWINQYFKNADWVKRMAYEINWLSQAQQEVLKMIARYKELQQEMIEQRKKIEKLFSEIKPEEVKNETP